MHCKVRSTHTPVSKMSLMLIFPDFVPLTLSLVFLYFSMYFQKHWCAKFVCSQLATRGVKSSIKFPASICRIWDFFHIQQDRSQEWQRNAHGGAKTGLHLWVCETQSLLLYYYLLIIIQTVSLLLSHPVGTSNYQNKTDYRHSQQPFWAHKEGN